MRLRQADSRGGALMDLVAGMAISALAALPMLRGLRSLDCALRVAAGRQVLASSLLEARRMAYRSEATTWLRVRVGEGSVALWPTGGVRALGSGVTVVAAPADGDVQFRGSGLADNATVALACEASRAEVVVNQRGVVR